MEKEYWLRRQATAAGMARRAASSRARLIHFEFAGRYAARAAQCGPFLLDATPSSEGERSILSARGATEENPDAAYYLQLEAGADYLAENTSDPTVRAEHLKMARIYRDRAVDAARWARK